MVLMHLSTRGIERIGASRNCAPNNFLGCPSVLGEVVERLTDTTLGSRMSRIGLLNEKPLHASLKEWCKQPGDQCEVALDGFVIDIVRDDLLLEIQTGNFASIKSKLSNLILTHHVRLVYPIAQEKWIIKLPKEEHSVATRRKSPRRGRAEDLFREMVSLPQFVMNTHFSLEVLLIKEEEVRRYEGKRKRRRGGWVIEERRLLEVVTKTVYDGLADWRAFLPTDLGVFTARELAETIGVDIRLAQKMVYCLRQMTVVKSIGKRQRANLYQAVVE